MTQLRSTKSHKWVYTKESLDQKPKPKKKMVHGEPLDVFAAFVHGTQKTGTEIKRNM
jgi:hypothetical protein